MKMNIVCIPGDGIGPEIVTQAKNVLNRVAEVYGHEIKFTDILMGGASIDATGVPLTEEAIATAKAADAVLMGSIGGDTNTSPWYKLPPEKRPEAGLLGIRKALNLFANLRPAMLYPELYKACPLKESVAEAGFDMLIMRLLDDYSPVGGLYLSKLIQHDLFHHVVQLFHGVHGFAVTLARMPHTVMTLIAEAGFLFDRAVLPFPRVAAGSHRETVAAMAAVHVSDQKRVTAHVHGRVFMVCRSSRHQLLRLVKGFGVYDLKLRHDLGFRAAVAYHAGIAAVFEDVVKACIREVPAIRSDNVMLREVVR